MIVSIKAEIEFQHEYHCTECGTYKTGKSRNTSLEGYCLKDISYQLSEIHILPKFKPKDWIDYSHSETGERTYVCDKCRGYEESA